MYFQTLTFSALELHKSARIEGEVDEMERLASRRMLGMAALCGLSGPAHSRDALERWPREYSVRPIDPKRLAAVPWTDCCAACQAARENYLPLPPSSRRWLRGVEVTF